MQESEIIGLLYDLNEILSQDFEFFITLTFAVIVVSFLVGDKIERFAKVVIAILYSCAAIMIFSRYYLFMEQVVYLLRELDKLGSQIPVSDKVTALPTTLRIIIYALGSIMTVILVLWPSILRSPSQSNTDSTQQDNDRE